MYRVTPIETIEFILNNKDNYSRNELARRTGVNIKTVRRILTRRGYILNLPYLNPIDKDTVAKIIEMFPNHTYKEITKATGVSEYRIRRLKKKFSLEKSSEYKKLGETFKRRWKYDELLINSGQKPIMNRRHRAWNRGAYFSAHRMCNKYNYFIFLDDPYRVYYDSKTTRIKDEEKYEQRWNYKFIKADEED